MLFFLDYDDGFGGRFSNSPGLLPLIGYTRQAGFDVDFIDSEDDLLTTLKANHVDVVGISSMERLLPRSVAVARKVREAHPNLILMLGGNSIEAFATDLAAGLFDIVVTGEGEHVLPAVLRAIARDLGLYCPAPGPPADATVNAIAKPVTNADPGGALSSTCLASIMKATFRRTLQVEPEMRVDLGISGIYLRDPGAGLVWSLQEPDAEAFCQLADARLAGLNDQPANLIRAQVRQFSTGSAPLNDELDGTCVYPWDLVETHDWSTLEFYSQRGCKWGRCEFCSIGDRNIRALSHEKIIEILREAARCGATVISFSDDLFVQTPEWNRELLERLLPLDLNLKFRAQTMATRSVWPILELLQRTGFFELSFGVETLNANRARFMAKSFNGAKYVENAKETIARVAEAGICPVLYMIMTDPRSSLLEIVEELDEIVEFIASVYERTSVVPKLSYTLIMLPVAGPIMTTRFPYTTNDVDLGHRVLKMPAEFRVPPAVARYLMRIAHETSEMPYRRENLSAIACYLSTGVEVAIETDDEHLDEIRRHVEHGLAVLEKLTRKLDQDVENTARSLLALDQQNGIDFDPHGGPLRFEFTRFGGYIAGVQRYFNILGQACEH